MTTNRKYVRLREQGRRLASQREDFIAASLNPAEILLRNDTTEPRKAQRTPRHADLPTPDIERQIARDLANVWAVVVVACIAAFAGCLATAGAMLMVSQDPTWHVWVAALAGLGWIAAGAGAIVHTRSLYRYARDEGAVAM